MIGADFATHQSGLPGDLIEIGELERLEQLRQEQSNNRLQAAFSEKVIKAYGSVAAYDDFKVKIGIAEEQALNFERYGKVLQPKQMEFAVWARRLDTATAIELEEMGAPELGMGGAKGPGKSYALFAQTALDDCQRFPGLKCLYLRKTGVKAKEQIEDLIQSVLAGVPHTYTSGRVSFPNGSYIIIGHYNTEKEAMNYAGIEYDVIIIEETTQLSLKAYTALRGSARTSKNWRPRIYNSTNPLGVGHQWYKLRFIEHERKYADLFNRTRKFIFATVNDNRFVNDDYRGTLEELTGVERRAYLEGDWDVSAGAFFECFRRKYHVMTQPLEDLSWMSRIWGSMDYGFNHWNVTYLHAQDGDGNRYTVHELAHRKHYPSDIAPLIIAMLESYGLTLKDLKTFKIGADAFNKTGLSEYSIVEQYRAAGIHLTRAETAAGSRIGGAQYLSSLLGDPENGKPSRWFISPRCPRLITCLPSLERDPTNNEDVLKVDADENGVGGDDPYDAVRYGLYTPRASRMSS